MSTTSTAVKRRYNEKTYKRFYADLRISDYEKLEAARGEMSRAQFLLMLFDHYQECHSSDHS